MLRSGKFLLTALVALGCNRGAGPSPEPAPPVADVALAVPAASSVDPASTGPAALEVAAEAAAPVASTASGEVPDAPTALQRSRYGWLANPAAKAPPAVDALSERFPTPPAAARVPLAPDSFGAWLRGLPLAPAGTGTTTHRGEPVKPGDDDYLAAVVALDVGDTDLQQSSDLVVRLHAEWLWSRDERTAIVYRSASNFDLPLSRWEKGERVVAVGGKPAWMPREKGRPADHGSFRRFLETVFAFSNSTSLGHQARPVPAEEVQPGDFFLHAGSPNHALVVLDMATRGETRFALFGFAPRAESMQVLRPGRGTPWFSLRPGVDVLVPGTRPFPWEGLRRLETRAR